MQLSFYLTLTEPIKNNTIYITRLNDCCLSFPILMLYITLIDDIAKTVVKIVGLWVNLVDR